MLRDMNEIHDEHQILLPLIGKLVERIDLSAISVDECNPAFFSFWIPVLRFIEPGCDRCFGRVVKAGPDARRVRKSGRHALAC